MFLSNTVSPAALIQGMVARLKAMSDDMKVLQELTEPNFKDKDVEQAMEITSFKLVGVLIVTAGKMNAFGTIYAYADDLADKLRAYADKLASYSPSDMGANEECIREILKGIPEMLENCHRRT